MESLTNLPAAAWDTRRKLPGQTCAAVHRRPDQLEQRLHTYSAGGSLLVVACVAPYHSLEEASGAVRALAEACHQKAPVQLTTERQ